MKNQITILEDYFNSVTRALSGFLLIWLFFGSLYLFRTPLFPRDLIIGVLCLLGLILLGALFFSKKALLVENRRIYEGIIFRDKMIFKREIILQNVMTIKIYDNKDQMVIPAWISMTGNLLTDEKAYTLKLAMNDGKEKYLISFKNATSKNKAVGFFKTNTDLEIKTVGNNVT